MLYFDSMSNAPAAKTAAKLRYWTDTRPSWQGSAIRVEWTRADGTKESSYGLYDVSDDTVNWQHNNPPAALEELALECARDGREYDVSGAEHVGEQSMKEMDFECSRMCAKCGVAQESQDALSEMGHCTRCFVEQMGTTGVVAAAPLEMAVQS